MTDKTHLRFQMNIKFDCCTRMSQEMLINHLLHNFSEISGIATNINTDIKIENVMLCTCNDLEEDTNNDR